jgi:CheY-like chemotaxis protein
MPIMNGWDFLDGLQGFNSEGRVKVIMLTSSINDEDRDMAKSYASVIGFLSKPIDEEKVKSVYELINY